MAQNLSIFCTLYSLLECAMKVWPLASAQVCQGPPDADSHEETTQKWSQHHHISTTQQRK